MSSASSNPHLNGESKQRPSRKSWAADPSPIEVANDASNEEFIQRYLKPESDWTTWIHPRTGAEYTLDLQLAQELTAKDLQSCFDMIYFTSGEDYRASSQGWHPVAKKKEMRSADLRYVLVRDGDGAVKGFTSLMPTFEDGEPVIFCYEIHLLPELQQTGLAKQLMGHLMAAAENIPSVEKVMLNCFTSNARAFRFYEKLGFAPNDLYPQGRRLRGGKVVLPEYMSLVWRTGQER